MGLILEKTSGTSCSFVLFSKATVIAVPTLRCFLSYVCGSPNV
ncbi:uncharacterized protein PpBr36_11339 [Pyricularia pennisetigena]|nr:uncharacterized protein PpBr36_11339 [Pyricularia pennisetigena]TLS20470.1 hypothetical protein PpBr36_11339 [Pyricularia pennisetigena]